MFVDLRQPSQRLSQKHDHLAAPFVPTRFYDPHTPRPPSATVPQAANAGLTTQHHHTDGQFNTDFSSFGNAFASMVPGDKGFDISTAGGEHEVSEDFAQGLAGPDSESEFCISSMAVSDRPASCRVDERDRRIQIEQRNLHWNMQIDKLVDAYLAGMAQPSPICFCLRARVAKRVESTAAADSVEDSDCENV